MSIKELDNVSEVYKKLLKSMETVDKKYSTDYNPPSTDDSVGSGKTKIEYTMPTQEQIESLAHQYYAADKTSDIANINNKTDSSINSLSDKAKKVLNDATKSQAETEKERKSGLRNANYASQVKNLSDSSIKTGLEDKVNTLADNELKDIETQKNNEITSLEEQIAFLQKLREQKLADIEEIYKQKVEQKTTEITEDAQNEQRKTQKYNNTIEEEAQKEAEKQLKQREEEEIQRLAELKKLIEEIGESGVAKKKKQEKYDAIKSILDQMTPNQALQFLNATSAFYNNLGEELFNLLVEYYKQKSESQE